MRCPYCGGLNPDQADYCMNCGRDFKSTQPSQPAPRPSTPSRTQNQRTVYPPNPSVQRVPGTKEAVRSPLQRPSVYPPIPPTTARPTTTMVPATQATKNAQQRPAATHYQNARYQYAQSTFGTPLAPSAAPISPAAPESFPPRTVTQMRGLEKDALDYKEVSQEELIGKKKLIRIQFRQCADWQQVATLFKALSEYHSTQYDTIIIQGVYNQESGVNEYTNGQLVFDRNVRLGSQTQNRYQIETDNGYSADALRIVLSE